MRNRSSGYQVFIGNGRKGSSTRVRQLNLVQAAREKLEKRKTSSKGHRLKLYTSIRSLATKVAQQNSNGNNDLTVQVVSKVFSLMLLVMKKLKEQAKI